MALSKLFERIFWHNNTTPAINEDNLNAMSKAIDDIDDRIIEIAGDVMAAVTECNTDAADAANSASAAANSATTASNAATVATSKANEASGYATTASNKAGEASGYATTASNAATTATNKAGEASTSATSANNNALKAEGYAVGKQNGTNVSSGSVYHENNAKYYKEQAANSATSAATSASRAEAWSAHPPYIGANGNWYVYDVATSAYVDSEIDASITITIGTTTTLEPGNDAQVTNVGTNTDAIFNFGIPKGAKGDTGATGATGTTPDITITATADATSSANPSVTVTEGGTAEAPTFALAFSGLKGTKGDTGNTGATGADGVSPEVTITNIAGGHRVSITDADHPSGQSFDVMDGAGSGDMMAATYDNDSTVAIAGGIVDYVEGDFRALDLIEDLSAYSAINVKDKGAVGDGTTDDSAAFIAAFSDAIANNKNIIVIPRGTYNLSNTNMVLGAAFTLIGESNKLTTIVDASIEAPYGITAKSITFDGGTQRRVYESGYPSGTSSLQYADSMQDKDVTIFTTPRYNNASVIYENCVFKNTDIASLAWDGTPRTGDLAVTNFVNNIVTGCVFENITNCAIWHSVDIANAEYTGNVFKNIGKTNIGDGKVWGISLGNISNTKDNEVTNALISNNVFDTINTETDTSGVTHAINANFIAVDCDKAVIINNVFNNLNGYGSDREGIYTKGNSIEIANNLLINCSAGGEGYICAKHKAFKMYHTRCMSIHNNTFLGEYGNAIRCYGTGVIRDNYISIRNMWRVVRGSSTYNEMVDGVTASCSLTVENNIIYCGIGSNPVDANYTQDIPISVSGEYFGGLYFNNNHLSFFKDASYSGTGTSISCIFKAQNVAGDVEIKNNIIGQDVVGKDIQTDVSIIGGLVQLTDATSTHLTSARDITISIENNQCPMFSYNAATLNISKNAYLRAIYKIQDNIIKKVLRTSGGAYPYYITNRASNTDVVYYESKQGVNEINNYAHVFTTASMIYTHLPSTYFNFNNTTPSIYSDDLKDYAVAPTIKTATLLANATSVTFTNMPTSGNNLIDFYIEGGANYTAINTATSGQVTLTYDAESADRAVYCRIEEVR